MQFKESEVPALSLPPISAIPKGMGAVSPTLWTSILKLELWNHLEGLLKASAGPHSRAPDSVSLGGAHELAFLTSFQVILMLLVLRAHR